MEVFGFSHAMRKAIVPSVKLFITHFKFFVCTFQGVKRAEMSNAIDVYVNGTVGQVL